LDIVRKPPILSSWRRWRRRHSGWRPMTRIRRLRMNRRALAELSLGHFLIDLCQGIVPALAPFLVEGRHFSRAAAAGLVFAISATSSVVQPVFGQLADRLAMPWLLPASILLAGASLACGAQAMHYGIVLAAFGLSGLGVAAFHPEAARKANLASGDRR